MQNTQSLFLVYIKFCPFLVLHVHLRERSELLLKLLQGRAAPGGGAYCHRFAIISITFWGVSVATAEDNDVIWSRRVFLTNEIWASIRIELVKPDVTEEDDGLGIEHLSVVPTAALPHSLQTLSITIINATQCG